MTPFDPAPKDSQEIQQISPERAPERVAEGIENKTGIITEAVPARSDEELPPCWQLPPGAPHTSLYIHGPKAAVFDTPPENAEPGEPEERVGAELTARQLLFCERFVERPVASRAAREAGYAETTAAHQASRLLKHPLVMRRILELRRQRRLEEGYRRETLMDKFDAVFAEAIERREFYAAIQALTMQARLARIDEAMPGFRVFRRFASAPEQLIWDAVARLEQKLSEIAVGDFPGAAAAVPAKSFVEGAAEEARKRQGYGSAEARAADLVQRSRKKK